VFLLLNCQSHISLLFLSKKQFYSQSHISLLLLEAGAGSTSRCPNLGPAASVSFDTTGTPNKRNDLLFLATALNNDSAALLCLQHMLGPKMLLDQNARLKIKIK
jgi:hypothetical protein